MTSLIRRRPFGTHHRVRTPFNALIDWNPVFTTVPRGDAGRPTLGVDAFYDDDNFVVNASVPGIDLEDINVTLDDGTLRIEAERDIDNSKEDGDYVIRERSRGVFHRSIRLPDGVDADQAAAKVENGVLTVTVPRSETSRARKLEVTSA